MITPPAAEKKLKVVAAPVEKPSVVPVPVVVPTPVIVEKPAVVPAPAIASAKAAALPITPQREGIPPVENTFAFVQKGAGSRLTFLNRVLAAVVLALLAIVVYSIASIRPGIGKALDRQISGAGSLSLAPQVVIEEKVPRLEMYLEKISVRDILAEFVVPKPGEVVAKPEIAGAPKDLKLVAVSVDSASAEDSMAIIKSKADSKTYFVKAGQTVGDTEYVLEKVLADRVVLKLKKQQYELK